MDLPPISIQHPPVIPHPPFPTAPAAAVNAAFPATVQLPPYPRMIEEAIRALNEPEGSSKRSIAKFIEGAYKDLPPTHPDLLTHCLRRLKDNGDLVMVKKSYKLDRSDNPLAADIPPLTPAASSGPKLGRGRPPKPKPDAPAPPNPHPVNLEAEPVPQVVLPSVVPSSKPTVPNSHPSTEGGRRRGRPKKNWPEQTLVVSKRPPGRPRKNGTVGSPKSPGRPRKFPVDAAGADAEQPVSNGVKRRGRPPKAQTQPQGQAQAEPQPVPQQQFMPQPQFHPPQFLPQFLAQQIPPPVMPFQAQPMVVPYADASAAVPNAAPAAEVVNAPRRRGRPKRTTAPVAAGTGYATGKRRGRPPKSGGVSKPMKPRKTTGRPMGRPRKKVEGSDSQSVAASYGDLKRKLCLFQSKVMQAVGVLKPQFTSESNVSAVAALQELEGLAAMDLINGPFTEPPLPPNGGLVHH